MALSPQQHQRIDGTLQAHGYTDQKMDRYAFLMVQ